MTYRIKECLMAAGIIMLVGCSSAHKYFNTGSDAGSANGLSDAAQLQSQGLGSSADISGEIHHLQTEEELVQVHQYHFAYDSDVVVAQDKPAIIAAAHYLASHPNEHIVLAGNTDDRGSREYNVALGWRRAQSIEKLMLLNGARKDQIKLVSYGEEKPVEQGENEDAYQENRRVENNEA
jgi:peptidoglycan-associated lipoprotein